MIKVYGSFYDARIQQVNTIIEKLFPSNRSSTLEQGSVFLSDGYLFECSVEEDNLFKRLALSADFKGNEAQLKDVMATLKKMLTDNGIGYDLEYEIEKDGRFTTYKID